MEREVFNKYEYNYLELSGNIDSSISDNVVKIRFYDENIHEFSKEINVIYNKKFIDINLIYVNENLDRTIRSI